MKQIIECVPNISEGRDMNNIHQFTQILNFKETHIGSFQIHHPCILTKFPRQLCRR